MCPAHFSPKTEELSGATLWFNVAHYALRPWLGGHGVVGDRRVLAHEAAPGRVRAESRAGYVRCCAITCRPPARVDVLLFGGFYVDIAPAQREVVW